MVVLDGWFWLILWVWWFVVMSGDAVVVVRWVWYRLFGWILVVCRVNGGGSRCFVESMVVGLGVLLGF